MLLKELCDTHRAMAAVRSRKAKAETLARLLRGLAPEERVPAIAWLTGTLPQGRIGVGQATVRELAGAPGAAQPSLTVAEVDAGFLDIAALAGRGSAGERKRWLGELFGRATDDEQAFLARVLIGELRQGGLDGIMADALALAADVDAGALRRAWMLAGNLPRVGAAVLEDGAAALERFALAVFTPVLPMLATPCEGVEDALGRLGEAALEHKLDGARVQVHREGDEVRVYTRGLLDVTAQVPELVAAAHALPARRLVLDGEVIALAPDGRPRPFQETMSRFSRRKDQALRETVPLSPFFFDVLLVDDRELVAAPAAERFAVLDALVPAAQRVPRLVSADPIAAGTFLQESLAAGHEGVMAKSLSAPYQVAARGQAWLKIKRAHTLDLVVLAVERGSGRRTGTLSNIHLGARDPATGGFIMLGKTFKGMTDAMLAWQTRRFTELAERDDGWVLWLRPEQVVEIEFDGLQASPHYPAGLALRFARVVRYRDDKRPEEADTIETVRGMFERERGLARR